MVPVVLRPKEDRVVGDAVIVALGHYGSVGVPEHVVVYAGVPSRVSSPNGPSILMPYFGTSCIQL